MAILEREDRGAVAHVRLNSPDNLNALSDAMLAALDAEFDRLMNDEVARVVVLSGAGRAFCAGHDLKEIQAGRQAPDGGAAYLKGLFDRCSAMMQKVHLLPQPVIAQVHGIAAAAGCQLVATCDLAVAADTARFAVNGVNIGLFCSTPMVALTRTIGRKAAFEMLVTGKLVDAPDAVDLGLVNRAVPEADLDAQTAALADQIAGKLGSAVRVGKRAFYQQIALPLDQAYAHTGEVMVQNMLNPDTCEGVAAFLEKRKPNWPS